MDRQITITAESQRSPLLAARILVTEPVRHMIRWNGWPGWYAGRMYGDFFEAESLGIFLTPHMASEEARRRGLGTPFYLESRPEGEDIPLLYLSCPK